MYSGLTLFRTPEKQTITKFSTYSFFSRSSIKQKVQRLSQVLSTKKRKTWNPLIYSPEVFKEGELYGRYDVKTSPSGCADVQNKPDTETAVDTMPVRNLIKSFQSLTVSNTADVFSEISEDSVNSSSPQQICVIEMVEHENKQNPQLQKAFVKENQSSMLAQWEKKTLVIPPRKSKKEILSQCGDFRSLDKHAILVSNDLWSDLSELVTKLTCRCRNDTEKARVIFRWVIAVEQKKSKYSRKHSDKTPARQLCHKIFAKLCRLAGLPCEIILGYSKGAGYKPGMPIDQYFNRNSWTAVAIDGQWRFVNCAWAARHVTAEKSTVLYKTDEFYFLTDPCDHIYQHFPDESKWQLLPSPLTKEEFVQLPNLKSPFFKYGISPCQNIPSVLHANGTGEADVEITVPACLRIGAKLLKDNPYESVEVSPRYVLLRKIREKIVIRVKLPTIGTYILSVFGGSADSEKLLECLFRTRVVCDNGVSCGPFPPVPCIGLSSDLDDGLICLKGLPDPLIHIKKNKVSLTFGILSGTKYKHTLQYYECENGTFVDVDRYAFPSHFVEKELRYSIACPRSGYYLFSLYGCLKGSRNYDCLFQSLINCERNDLSRVCFPKVSSGWRFCQLVKPLTGELLHEMDYDFHVIVPKAEHVFIVIGEKRHYLQRQKDDNWTGCVQTGQDSSKCTVFVKQIEEDYETSLLTYDLL